MLFKLWKLLLKTPYQTALRSFQIITQVYLLKDSFNSKKKKKIISKDFFNSWLSLWRLIGHWLIAELARVSIVKLQVVTSAPICSKWKSPWNFSPKRVWFGPLAIPPRTMVPQSESFPEAKVTLGPTHSNHNRAWRGNQIRYRHCW